MISTPAYKKSSFGPAFFFLKRRQRRALADYYAFCRLADDIADEPNQPNPEAQLNALAQEIQYIYINAPQTPWGEDLLKDIQQFDISKDRFTLLLEGMQADLSKKSYSTFEELDWYLYRVAVIVGKATLDILGVRGPQADKLALALGTAVQLTNIVRDVYEDAKTGRVYLPGSLTALEILQNPQSDSLYALLSQTTARAEENYRRAFQLMDEFWPVTMLPCRIMGYVYQKNLAKIKKSGFSFTQSIKLNKSEKLQMVGYAIIKTLF
ncbi:MAG: squalene/phytoene synthase family protein [Elusimicrobiaceae bacterium]|nr:squalene/phytoene synthase family protein [Elusimicrobiaceae bacterium]